MFAKNNREAPSYHTGAHFLEKDLGRDWVETAQLLLFHKSEAKQGVSQLNAKLFVTKFSPNSATFKSLYKLIISN